MNQDRWGRAERLHRQRLQNETETKPRRGIVPAIQNSQRREKMKRIATVLLISAAAATMLFGCVSGTYQDAKGNTCQAKGFAVPLYGQMDSTCQDTSGKIVSSSHSTVW